MFSHCRDFYVFLPKTPREVHELVFSKIRLEEERLKSEREKEGKTCSKLSDLKLQDIRKEYRPTKFGKKMLCLTRIIHDPPTASAHTSPRLAGASCDTRLLSLVAPREVWAKWDRPQCASAHCRPKKCTKHQ